MKIVRTLIALALVAAAGGWAYYTNVASVKPAMDMSARVTGSASAFPVTVAAVERGPVRGGVVYTGSVAAYTEEDVYPRVTGRIVEMPVYPGDSVKEGQVVARLDDVELTSRVREADAAAVSARANRAQTEADATAARHGVVQVERELAVAQADLVGARHGAVQTEKELAMVEAEAAYQQSLAAREERLFGSGAVSRQDVENARSMAAAARARVQAAQAKAEQAKSTVTAAQARLDATEAKLEQVRAMEASARWRLDVANALVTQGQAQVKTAQVVHDYVNLRATTSGYVVKRLVAPGVLVQPGMPVLKIVQVDRVRLQANVGEKDLAGIRVGSPVTVIPVGSAGQPFTVRVTSIFPFVDPGARTAVVEAVVENAGRRLLPGQYMQMQFVTGERPDALSAPREAVVRLGGGASVWVVAGDRAERREVTTGVENAERVEILTGLREGERVVLRGQDGLYAGARVSDVATATPAAGHAGHSAAGTPPSVPASPPAQPAAPAPSGHGGHAVEKDLAQAPPAGKPQVALSASTVKLSSGSGKVRVEVKDASSQPMSGATVEVRASMTGMNTPKVSARPTADPGVYEATLNFGMAGAWTVEVTATAPQGTTASAKFKVEAK